MFVLRRKSDGKFRTGKSPSKARCWANENGYWIDDLQKVKPFHTAAAFKSKTGRHFYNLHDRVMGYKKHLPPPPGECCKQMKSSYKGYTHLCEHFKKAMKLDQEEWNDTYEVLEVRLEIVRQI
jgi:hypothetical protein